MKDDLPEEWLPTRKTNGRDVPLSDFLASGPFSLELSGIIDEWRDAASLIMDCCIVGEGVLPPLSSLLLTLLLSLLLGEGEEDEGFDQFHVDEHLAAPNKLCCLLLDWTLFLGTDENDAQDVYCIDGNGDELLLMHGSIFLADLELVIILRYVIMLNSSEKRGVASVNRSVRDMSSGLSTIGASPVRQRNQIRIL